MIYEYKCENCQPFEVYQRMTDKALVKCPHCSGKIERIIWGGVHASVKSVTTLGQQAEANAKKYGKELTELKLEEQKTEKTPAGDNAKRPMELPAGSTRKQSKGQKIDKDLIEATPKEKQRYIMTGQRPTPKKFNSNF